MTTQAHDWNITSDLAKKASDDAMSAVKRTAALCSSNDEAMLIYLQAASVLLAAAGGTFAAQHGATVEDGTEAVFQFLYDLMKNPRAVIAKCQG